jgi:hypothetical protein
MRKGSLIPAVGFAIPALLISAAYLHMAVAYRNGWLFNAIVHENGRYTLFQTIFYFRHFTWEFLGKALYCGYVVGIFFFYGHDENERQKGRTVARWKLVLAVMLTFMIPGIALLMTARELGWGEAWAGLLQYRRNETSASEFGSHWRNHFLSNVALFTASAFFVILYRMVQQMGALIRRGRALFLSSVLVFVAVTLFFGFNRAQFEAPSYLGHQLRETAGADLPVTMLLALSLMVFLENKYDFAEQCSVRRAEISKSRFLALCWLLPALGATFYLGIRVLHLDIAAELAKVSGARKHSVLGTFSWHFFEHSLDYLFVMVTVYWLYLAKLKLDTRGAIVEK